MNSWSKNSRTRACTTRCSSARGLIDDVLGLSAKLRKPDIAASALSPFVRAAARGDGGAKAAEFLERVNDKDINDAVRYFDLGGETVVLRGFPAAKKKFLNGLVYFLSYKRSKAEREEKERILESAQVSMAGADLAIAEALEAASKAKKKIWSGHLEEAADHFTRAFRSAQLFVSKFVDEVELGQSTISVASSIRKAALSETAVPKGHKRVYDPLYQAFVSGVNEGMQAIEGEMPREFKAAVQAAEVRRRVSQGLAKIFHDTFASGSEVFSQFLRRYDPANVAKFSRQFARFGNAVAAAAMAAALHAEAEKIKDVAAKEDGQVQAEKIAIRGWENWQSEISAVLGENFVSAIDYYLSQVYPSDASNRRAADSTLKMSPAENKAVLDQFYAAVKDFFTSRLAPSGTNYVQQMFQRFPDSNSPFEWSLKWMVAKHKEVAKKPDKTLGDIEFLKLYANSGFSSAARGGYMAVAGEADALKKSWVAQQFGGAAPDDPDVRDYTRRDRSDAVGSVVRGLIALVQQGATGETLKEKSIYAKSDMLVKHAANLPPIPQPPASVLPQEGLVPSGQDGQQSEAPVQPERQQEQQGQDKQERKQLQVVGGGGMKALARAAQIFKELRSSAPPVKEEEERIWLTREQ